MFSMSVFSFSGAAIEPSMDQCFGANPNHNYIVGGILSVSEPTLPLSLSVSFSFLMYLLGFLLLLLFFIM